MTTSTTEREQRQQEEGERQQQQQLKRGEEDASKRARLLFLLEVASDPRLMGLSPAMAGEKDTHETTSATNKAEASAVSVAVAEDTSSPSYLCSYPTTTTPDASSSRKRTSTEEDESSSTKHDNDDEEEEERKKRRRVEYAMSALSGAFCGDLKMGDAPEKAGEEAKEKRAKMSMMASLAGGNTKTTATITTATKKKAISSSSSGKKKAPFKKKAAPAKAKLVAPAAAAGPPTAATTTAAAPKWRRRRRVRKRTFAEKLLAVLSDPAYRHAATWLPAGDAFVIANPEAFTTDVLPRYFKTAKFESFTRKLNRWGYQRISKPGARAAAYRHEHFRRDAPELSKKMTGGKRDHSLHTTKGDGEEHDEDEYQYDEIVAKAFAEAETAKVDLIHEQRRRHRPLAPAITAPGAPAGIPTKKLPTSAFVAGPAPALPSLPSSLLPAGSAPPAAAVADTVAPSYQDVKGQFFPCLTARGKHVAGITTFNKHFDNIKHFGGTAAGAGPFPPVPSSKPSSFSLYGTGAATRSKASTSLRAALSGASGAAGGRFILPSVAVATGHKKTPSVSASNNLAGTMERMRRINGMALSASLSACAAAAAPLGGETTSGNNNGQLLPLPPTKRVDHFDVVPMTHNKQATTSGIATHHRARQGQDQDRSTTTPSNALRRVLVRPVVPVASSSLSACPPAAPLLPPAGVSLLRPAGAGSPPSSIAAADAAVLRADDERRSYLCRLRRDFEMQQRQRQQHSQQQQQHAHLRHHHAQQHQQHQQQVQAARTEEEVNQARSLDYRRQMRGQQAERQLERREALVAHLRAAQQQQQGGLQLLPQSQAHTIM